VVLRMEYGNYVVNGVGPTSDVMSYIYTIIRRIITVELTWYIIFPGTDRACERDGQDKRFIASAVGLSAIVQRCGSSGQGEHRRLPTRRGNRIGFESSKSYTEIQTGKQIFADEI